MVLKVDNQKTGHKGACIHHEANKDALCCPVCTLGHHMIHICRDTFNPGSFLSTYFDKGVCYNVSNWDTSLGLKTTVAALHYPANKGTPITQVNTHSLCSGGANALFHSSYADRKIKKMGHWKGTTFLKSIIDEIASFSKGISCDMQQHFGFTNIAGGASSDVS
ncbi:hypothetical protein ACHAXS_005968 [Conticribra weissflogii]